MPDPITLCLCGADDLTVGPSTKRLEAREQYEEQKAASEQAGLTSGPAMREHARITLALQVLSRDDAMVSCGTCGRWVHDDSEDHAINTWNRAIAKRDRLQPCCESSSERRMDYDGMVLCVCTSPEHDSAISGPRWLPLEPAEDYEPKPSEAGVSR